MITVDQLVRASRSGVLITIPELDRDIDAQIRCLADPDHPKEAVFLARGNPLGDRSIPPGVFITHRQEGTLLSISATLSALFLMVENLTDADLADLLCYPEAKADVLMDRDGVVVQSIDADGCVVYEVAASPAKIDRSIAEAERQRPRGGEVKITTPFLALARRIKGRT